MGKAIKNACFLKTIVFIFLSFCSLSMYGQADTTKIRCGYGSDLFLQGGGGGAAYLPSAVTFDPTAIVTCGKIDLYYADIAIGNITGLHAGFDDHTPTSTPGVDLGTVRRNTYCAVVNYIQSVFDFSNVSSTNHIRIFVDTSFNPITHSSFPPMSYYARAWPKFDSTVDGIKNGWMNDYINRPSWYLHDSIPDSVFHGVVQVNFDNTYTGTTLLYDSFGVSWVSDYTQNVIPCENIDLYNALLHEMGHVMGWFSLAYFTGSGGMLLTPVPTITGHNIFSGLDWKMNVGNNTYPLSPGLTRFINGTTSSPTINSSVPISTFYNNNNYWLNGNEAPDNHPVYSGDWGSGGTANSYLSHLDDQTLNYTLRGRVSPGDQQEYIMGPFCVGSERRRLYTKGELQSFVNALGYTTTTTYNSANPYIYGNHVPLSQKMSSYSITQANYGNFTETVTPDATIVNDIGTSVTLNLSSSIFLADITDADGDYITIDSASLVNFRGCGDFEFGSYTNNHNLLTISSDHRSITYTPRANFYGKAQFGFNLTDGKEKGSYEVVTIEVQKGTNVSCAPGANMVCNPDFEQGSELKKYSLDVSQVLIPNATATQFGLHEGKWQGISFSDSHPYCFKANQHNSYTNGIESGIVVAHTTACGLGYLSGYGWYYGHFGVSLLDGPDIGTALPIDNPAPVDTTSRRYQMFYDNGGSYYYLADSAKHCKRYFLEFYLYRPFFASGSSLHLTIGFANHLTDLGTTSPVFNYNFDTNVPFTVNAWVPVSIPFWYCGDSASNILFIGNPDGNTFHIDSLVLREDLSPPALTVNVTQTPVDPCTTELTANVTNAACFVTYDWSGPGITGVTTQTVNVSPSVTTTYTVTVYDGCRTASTITTVYVLPPAPIAGPTSVCAGSSITLTDAVGGGVWSSSNTGIATVGSATGVVTGVSASSVTITYTTCVGYVTYTVTVYAAPTPIIGIAPVCTGLTVTLSDAVTGGSWSISPTSIATISSGGIVTGVSGGNAIVTYAIGTCSVTAIETVTPNPAAITGTLTICGVTGTTTLSDAVSGGSWASGTPSVATVSSSGVVTAVSVGAAVITYSLGSCFVTTTVNVHLAPTAITGTWSVCAGANTTLSSTPPGGTWSIAPTSVATVLGGVVHGVSAGTAIVSYTSGGCRVTAIVTVNPSPSAITGTTTLCMGYNTTLSDAVGGGSWISSDPTIATVDATGVVHGVATGTVTISYTLPGGCFVTTTVTVFPGGGCGPCTIFKVSYTPLGLSGTISAGTYPAGNYYINNDVTITGSVTFNNAIILIAPGVNVYVNPNAALKLTATHMFCCGSMWAGITLLTNTAHTSTGRIILQADGSNNSTLIEDAYAAISINNPAFPSGSGANFIQSTNTIFNRNWLGISISNYSPATPHTYPFDIENTVFTSRDFGNYFVTGSIYPFAWPQTTGTYGLKTLWTPPSPYLAPYNIGNPTGGPSSLGYPGAPCHIVPIGFGGPTGISLSGVGTSTYPNYASVVIGTPNTTAAAGVNNTKDQNLFDTLSFGINAGNANLIVHNSIFAHMLSHPISKTPTPSEGGCGIYASMVDKTKYQVIVEPSTFITGGGVHVHSTNYFYNCHYGLYANNYYHIKGDSAYMITTQDYTKGNSGYFGYEAISGAYDSVFFNQNTITNIANGISFTSTYGTTVIFGGFSVPSEILGNISADNNTIQAAYPGTSLTTQYVSFGIGIYNTLNAIGPPYPWTYFSIIGNVHTNGNKMINPYRGIQVQSYWMQHALSNSNNITLVLPDAISGAKSYGISHSDCNGSEIYENYVSGSVATPLNDNMSGYYVASNPGAQVHCNFAVNIGRGFDFTLINAGTKWHDNTMNNNLEGLMINGGYIGQQGMAHYPANNHWDPTVPWTGAHYQTYVQGGALATSSPMFVKNPSPTLNPTNNTAAPVIDLFTTSNTSLTVTDQHIIPIPCIYPLITATMTPLAMRLHEKIAKKQMLYPTDSAVNDWLGQYTTWLSMGNDSTYADSSDVLNIFQLLSQNSRYKGLTDIENAMVKGDMTTASAKLLLSMLPLVGTGTFSDSATGVNVADDDNSDFIVNNYKAYYGVYLNYMNGVLSSDDSAQIVFQAGLCPSRYGAAVYRARSLYTAVFNDLKGWNDDSCAKADTGSHAAGRHSLPGATGNPLVAVTRGQHYFLFPNPNDGMMTLTQMEEDNAPVLTEITDVVGRSVYKSSLLFNDGTYRLKLDNLAPGIYIMQLTDAQARKFMFKFVKE